jgi:hypothetical protein
MIFAQFFTFNFLLFLEILFLLINLKKKKNFLKNLGLKFIF